MVDGTSTAGVNPNICSMLGFAHIPSKEARMADRRAGRIPHVPDEGGGQQPRSPNKDGRWRKKRSDTGQSRSRAQAAWAFAAPPTDGKHYTSLCQA